MTSQELERIWLPLGGFILAIGLFASTIAAIVAADWRYLLGVSPDQLLALGVRHLEPIGIIPAPVLQSD